MASREATERQLAATAGAARAEREYRDKLIVELRVHHGLSLRELGALAHMSHGGIAKVLDRAKVPGPHRLPKRPTDKRPRGKTGRAR